MHPNLRDGAQRKPRQLKDLTLVPLCLAGALLIAGCSNPSATPEPTTTATGTTSPDPGPTETDPPAPTKEHVAWLDWLTEPAGDPIWSVELETFGEGITIVDDAWFTYVNSDGELEFYVGRLDTGDKIWSAAASQGFSEPSQVWPLKVIEADGGVPAVTLMGPTELDAATNYYLHQAEIRTVAEGLILGETEPNWFHQGTGMCTLKSAVCAHTFNEDAELYDSSVIHHDGTVDLLLSADYGYVWALGGELFIAENLTRGVSELVRSDGGSILWSVDLDTFGITGLEALDPVHFSAFGNVIDGREIATVEIVDTREMPTEGNTDNFVTTSSTIAFDWTTGEQLWSIRDGMALSQNVYIKTPEGEISWQAGPNEMIQARTGDWIATGVDPLTGEVLWEVDLPQADFSTTRPRLLTGSADFMVINSAGTLKLFDLRDGELSAPPAGAMFSCLTDGDPISLPAYSIPTEDAVDFTQNNQFAGCYADGQRVTDPSGLTKAAVIGGSSHWQPWDTPHSDEDPYSIERTYIIANETGVHAYRF